MSINLVRHVKNSDGSKAYNDTNSLVEVHDDAVLIDYGDSRNRTLREHANAHRRISYGTASAKPLEEKGACHVLGQRRRRRTGCCSLSRNVSPKAVKRLVPSQREKTRADIEHR